MPVCESCGQEGSTQLCSGCHESWYCGAACQRQHWKAGHKHKCVNKAEKPSASAAAVKEAAATPLPAAQSSDGGGALASHDEKCTICLDTLQQPQTMPCGHRFCRGCVASMRRYGAAVAQVCPLCRGAMPDAERLHMEALRLLAQHNREGQQSGWLNREGHPVRVALPAAVQPLVEKAAALCREALAIDPADAHAQYTLGCALSAAGDNAGAVASYSAAIAANPQDLGARVNMGVILNERGDTAGAEAAYRAAITAATTADPQYAEAHVNLGGLLIHQREDKAGAEACFRAAIAADPQCTPAHYNLGGILLESAVDRMSATQQQFAELQATSSAGTKLAMLARFNEEASQDLARAARSFAAVLKIDPSHAQAKEMMQNAFRMMKMMMKNAKK